MNLRRGAAGKTTPATRLHVNYGVAGPAFVQPSRDYDAAGRIFAVTRSEAQAFPRRSRGCKLRGGPKISRRMIALRNPAVEWRSVAISALPPLGVAFGTLVTACVSTGDLVES